MNSERIDVHTHLIPPFYAEELKAHGGDPSGWGSPDWSPKQAIGFMDDEGIALAMLSLTAPGIDGWRVGEERADIARKVNDYGASLVQERPDRFGYLATLALPDVDPALKEKTDRIGRRKPEARFSPPIPENCGPNQDLRRFSV